MGDKYKPGDRITWVNAQFTAPKGFELCPKCAGDGEHEISRRTHDGWPIGPISRKTCDYCEGAGYVTPEKAASAPVGCASCGMAGEHGVTCPMKPSAGWAVFKKEN